MGSYKNGITDWDIQALVDDELSEPKRKFVTAHIARDPKLKKRYEVLMIQKQLLQDAFL